MPTDRLPLSQYADGPGYSLFGQAHGPGIDLRPELPQTTHDVIGVDLTETLHTDEIASAAKVAGGNGKGGGPGGGGGGGGGTTFADFTTSFSNYNITIHFNGTMSQELHDTFVNSANRISQLIIGDVPNVTVLTKGGVIAVDDIYITAEIKAIDGVGGILGQAGPTSVRTVGSLPATATMTFDVADAQNYYNQGLFDEIVTHEMLHSVGVGSIWDRLGLLSGYDFTGANAVAEYNTLLAAAGRASSTTVPVESGGGSGTAGSHWSESVFHNELMTGYIDLGSDPLSRMTVASLADLGYQININGPTDPYGLV
jgi:hypothetical protein